MPLNVGLILVGMFLLIVIVLLDRLMNVKNIQSKISEGVYMFIVQLEMSICAFALLMTAVGIIWLIIE
ncbi:MAG TPA: hypothetical protein PKK07_01935 [bacterium]|jgi:hypothetical protein|nr:hypothetical protein [Candidatus Dojkabacteria bacterium]HNS71464.1 hypothetical protein [bacterium]HOK59862.1 hypothetical protein [Candidatus Dojkabacteria bacterium]HOV17755.1 hypothetical protein [Candidatus Dojkabacteria bacterium]HPP18910.1 hypothetical protein [Candidatus Dojkabacteria bacterium]